MDAMRFQSVALFLWAHFVAAGMPFSQQLNERQANPPWLPTYQLLHGSLITMQANSSGFSSPVRGSEFGIVSYDWSNAKDIWAKQKPMNCEELLTEQAEQTKLRGTEHVFVYRNIVKALPWFTFVREKLDDPSYEGFFLKFKHSKQQPSFHVPECAAENNTHCSLFYHDQLQTPQVPTDANPHPDGSCDDYCDCGLHPCGEYLFDHRNETLRQWLIDKVILGPTAVGHPAIDGLFLDDYWCSDLLCKQALSATPECPCDNPRQGPSEIDLYAQLDMGLTDEDIFVLTKEWRKTMYMIQVALLENKTYTWSLMLGQENANAQPLLLTATECTSTLREACTQFSTWQTSTMLFGFTVGGSLLLQLEQDLAFFLLARGPYAYAGYGLWGMTWPFNPEQRHGSLPPLPNGVPLPKEFYFDYGGPHEICSEVSDGVFQREWSRASVQLDCNNFAARIDRYNISALSKYSAKSNY
jgi:hypothetical protein